MVGSFATTLDALTVILSCGGLGYEDRAALYASAKEAKLDHVAFLFLEHTPTDEGFPPERPIVPGGKPLSLGERKAIARTGRRELLEKLVADPHPHVVEVLLQNPRLTEPDVLRITSRRPISEATLDRVIRNDRFRPRPAVRRSLCLNPHLPVPLAARLMTMLAERDLRSIGSDASRSALLRLPAKSILDLRDRSPTPIGAPTIGA